VEKKTYLMTRERERSPRFRRQSIRVEGSPVAEKNKRKRLEKAKKYFEDARHEFDMDETDSLDEVAAMNAQAIGGAFKKASKYQSDTNRIERKKLYIQKNPIDYEELNLDDLYDNIMPNVSTKCRTFKSVHFPTMFAYDVRNSLLLIASVDYLFKFYRGRDGELAMITKDRIRKFHIELF
jgi:hypothetical protein